MKIASIEFVDHFYHKATAYETYVVHYSSGKVRMYENNLPYSLPQTVKAFLKSHYDEYTETELHTRYRYKAINIIK